LVLVEKLKEQLKLDEGMEFFRLCKGEFVSAYVILDNDNADRVDGVEEM